MNRLLIEYEPEGWHVQRHFDKPLDFPEAMAFLEVLIQETNEAMASIKRAWDGEHD